MANGSHKGRRFECQTAEKLSLWWSNEEHEDLCWHVHDSGGRATRRTAKGKGTRSAYGDLCATDRTMQPFFDLFVVELKKGYPSATLHTAFDHTPDKPGRKNVNWNHWIAKVTASSAAARVPYWLLIHKRDYRNALAVLPDHAVGDLELKAECCLEGIENEDWPVLRFYHPDVFHSYLWVFRLDDLLRVLMPEHIRTLARKRTEAK